MSKYTQIADSLKEEITKGVYIKGAKLPTEAELSGRYGVSRQTVRAAIASLKNEGLVFQRQGSGTYVSTPLMKKREEGTPLNVQVICTYISDYIFPGIIRGIEQRLSRENIAVKLSATGNMVERERAILGGIISRCDTDAIIIEGTKSALPNPNIALLDTIRDMNIPIVFIHSAYPEIKDPVVVGMNDRKGGKMAVEALYASGCRRIGGIFKSDDMQGLLRYKGFIEASISLGIGLENTTVKWFMTEDEINGSHHMNENQITFFASLDGVVCYNDQEAASFIGDCLRSGMEVPEIVSFDRSALPEVPAVRFTSLGHRKDTIGLVAAEKVLNMLNGKKETSVFFDWQ